MTESDRRLARIWLSSPCWSARDYAHPALVLGALDGGPLPLNTRRWLEREAERRAPGGALRQSAHWARRLLQYFDQRHEQKQENQCQTKS